VAFDIDIFVSHVSTGVFYRFFVINAVDLLNYVCCVENDVVVVFVDATSGVRAISVSFMPIFWNKCDQQQSLLRRWVVLIALHRAV
jgi:hypothetical protein